MTFDPLVEERVAPGVTIGRDASDNPLIVPRGGTVEEVYTRASSLSKFLAEDSWNLSKWRERYLTGGLARSPDLCLRAAAVHYSTGPISGTQPISARKAAAAELDAVANDAKERAGISEAANVGTAGHSLTEPGSQGLALDSIVDTVAAYNELTAGLERVASEVFVANDELATAGTFDSLYWNALLPDRFIVGDTKTGKNFHQAEFEIQVASYAGGEVYLGRPVWDGLDESTVEHQRLTFEEFAGLPVDQDIGYIVHVSVHGSPKPRIVELDLRRGRALAKLCAEIRNGRIWMDSIGIGNKLDHRALAKHVLQDRLATLFDWFDTSPRDHGDKAVLRASALELYKQFKHVWESSTTSDVARRFET